MELNWIAAAMASTIIYAGVTIGDKLILTRLGIRLPAFYVFTGANQAIISLFILAFDPPRGVPLSAALAAYGGGAFWGAGLTLMFWGLTREQVSRVAPVWHTSPIFVAIVAVFVLGESLGWLHNGSPLRWSYSAQSRYRCEVATWVSDLASGPRSW